MDLASLPLFSALTRKMSWLTQRQTVLAQNVANVDTPGYRSSDLRPLDFRAELAASEGGGALTRAGGAATGGARLQLVATDAQHLAPPGGNTALRVLPQKDSPERQINGNTVSMEEEMMKVSETAADYQLMTDLYKKQVDLLMTAAGRGSN